VLVDAQTFRELEVFSTAGGAPSLFDILNRARTAGGRDALLRRFRQPLSSSSEIGEVQDALRFILHNHATFDLLPGDGQLKTVQNYLRANFTITSSSGLRLALESYWIQLRYPDIYREARSGVLATFGFVQQLARFLEVLDISALPKVLDDLVYTIRSQLLQSDILTIHAERLSPLRVFRLDQHLRAGAREQLQTLIDTCHELDAIVSMARVTLEKGFVFPEIDRNAVSIELDGVFHPFVEQSVVNDLQLAADQRVLFLTGPNMAGKTTYLKACAVAVLLAHLGMGVPARQMRCAPFACLFTGINTPDNLREGTSFFQAEARRVKQVADLLRRGVRAFVLFDEMLKGTNVKDAIDASHAVIRGLARAEGSVFLISSHLLELVPELQSNPGVVFHYFDAVDHGSDLQYDYKLKAGHSAQRLGMRVLQQEGVFDSLAAISAAAEADVNVKLPG
jgi:DNA mismatch repair protein MutS